MISIQANCTDIFEPGLLSVNKALNHILSSLPLIDDYEIINIENAKARMIGYKKALDLPHLCQNS